MMNKNLALTLHALREAFTGRRRIGLALLTLAPALLGLAVRQWSGSEPGASETTFLIFIVGLGLVIPLLALWIGVATLREEISRGTIVHLVTRPVSRAHLLLTRLAGAVLATWLMGGIALSLVFPAIGYFDTDTLLITWAVAGLAALAYTSLFALLGAATDRAILAGLAYLVAWEGVVASSTLLFRQLTIAYWLRSIVANQNLSGDVFFAGEIFDPAATSTALIVLAAIAAIAGLIGSLWFQWREFPGSEPG